MADAIAPLPPSQLRLFNRTCELTIANQPAPAPRGSPTFFAREPNALLVTGGSASDLRIKFEIKRHLGKTPNPGVVKVFNLAPESRARFNRSPVYIIMRAGHDGVLRPLFEGNVPPGCSISEIKDATWETKFQVTDGGRSYAHAEWSRSYAPPIRAIQVLSDTAGAMGLTLPPEVEQAPEFRQALEGGLSVHGPGRDTLTKLLSRYGFGWSIQSGRLQVLRQGATNQRRAWVIDADAGLIGSPESTLPHKPGKIAEITIKVLLFPEVVPGDSVQLTSRAFDHAVFRVNDVHHVGDTHGNEWITTLKCVPPGTPLSTSGRGR